jgi:hypothetical protein
LERRP